MMRRGGWNRSKINGLKWLCNLLKRCLWEEMCSLMSVCLLFGLVSELGSSEIYWRIMIELLGMPVQTVINCWWILVKNEIGNRCKVHLISKQIDENLTKGTDNYNDDDDNDCIGKNEGATSVGHHHTLYWAFTKVTSCVAFCFLWLKEECSVVCCAAFVLCCCVSYDWRF